MKVLNREELKKAEEALKLYWPQSQEVYGYVFLINKVKADPIDVLVDQWPDFSVFLIRPKRREKADNFKDVCIFAKNEPSLRNILVSDVLDWKQYICLSVNPGYEKMVKTATANRDVSMRKIAMCHMMKLQDASNLETHRLFLQVSSLNESHIALVNSMWKFGQDAFSERMIRNMIMNFPSCCLLDSEGQPVSWILTYASCALGMLYTMPEHRGKGYAKALIKIMAKKLYSEGFPVYCFIEEENQLSYRLFSNLGFSEVPSYRNSWFHLNNFND